MDPVNHLTIVSTLSHLKLLQQRWRDEQVRVALVPTMGNLHEGHFNLVRAAKKHADRVVVSIFVNPLQFGRGEDFERYPRTLDKDVLALTLLGVDAVFAPSIEAMYPDQVAMADEVTMATTVVPPSALTTILCGANRPGHFTGVATVVMKLFQLVQPNVALFGQKDYQQVAILVRMVRDLNLPIEILQVATTRSEDGLALSSRNQYLTEKERLIAPRLYQTLLSIADRLKDGDRQYTALTEQASRSLLASGFQSIDYVDIRHPVSLAPSQKEDTSWVVLIAAHLGKTRLIDNLLVDSTEVA